MKRLHYHMTTTRTCRLAVGLLTLLINVGASAQVVMDGTVGPAGPLTGPDFDITANLGTRVGGNLFHSFHRFGLTPAQSATFSGPSSVNNILARVTGGEASTINGLLTSTIPGANFFFINPAGVLIGPSGVIDVSGSFVGTSASVVGLADNGVFHAVSPGDSVLTAASPERFGFLNTAPGPVAVNSFDLTAAESQSITLIGGDVTIDGAAVGTTSGRINLISAASAGEVRLDATDPDTPINVSSVVQFGDVTIENGAFVEARDAGSIAIRAGRLIATGAFIAVTNNADTPGGGVDIKATGDVALGQGTLVTLDANATAATGDLSIEADRLLVTGSGINTGTFGPADAADVHIDAGLVLLDGQGGFGTGITTATIFGPGRGGDVHVTADRFEARGFALIDSSSFFSLGDAGRILIDAGEITIADGAALSSSTNSLARGGDIEIITDDLLIDAEGTQLFQFTGIVTQTFGFDPPSQPGDARGGDLTINAGTLRAFGASIGSSTDGTGRAGDVIITADEALFHDLTQVISSSFETATGNSGDLRVAADVVRLTKASVLSVDTFSPGDSGSIVVQADTFTLDGQDGDFRTGVFAETSGLGGGVSGDIQVDVSELEVLNGAQISSSTFGVARAGRVEVFADTILLERLEDGPATGIAAITFASLDAPNDTNPGGQVLIGSADRPVERIDILRGAAISASSAGSGAGGSIEVYADHIHIDHENIVFVGPNNNLRITGIEALSEGPTDNAGPGGDITVNVGTLVMRNGAQIIGGARGPGQGGQVIVNAERVWLDGEKTAINAASLDQRVTGPDLSVTFDIDHSQPTDLRGVLESPAGTRITLFDGVGGVLLRQGFAGTTLDDRVNPRISNDALAFPPFLGFFAPQESFAELVGEPVAGEWTLDIIDTIPSSDFGSLNAWSLTVAGVTTESVDVGQSIDTGATGSLAIRSTLDVVAPAKLHIGDAKLGATAGEGGSVRVNTGTLLVTNQANVSASTRGPGNAGRVEINADDITLTMDGLIESVSTGAGDAGSIRINVSKGISLTDGGTIRTSATMADAGDAPEAISITSQRSIRLTDALISSRAARNGGNIALNAPDLIHLINSAIAAEAGIDGGNVTIDPVAVILESSSIIANAVLGDGGDISITTQILLATPDSVISASSQFGLAGNIQVNSPDTDLAGSLANLPDSLLTTHARLSDACATLFVTGPSSTFTTIGRGGLPLQPDAAQPTLQIGSGRQPAGEAE